MCVCCVSEKDFGNKSTGCCETETERELEREREIRESDVTRQVFGADLASSRSSRPDEKHHIPPSLFDNLHNLLDWGDSPEYFTHPRTTTTTTTTTGGAVS